MSTESKITLYLAITNEQKRSALEMAFMTDYIDISVFALANQGEYEQRLKLNPPQLVIADAAFLQGNSILKDGTTNRDLAQTAYIVLGKFAAQEDFLDEVMVGKFQFFEQDPSEEDWKLAVKKSFKFCFDQHSSTYTLKKIRMGDLLMKIGDPAESIYILKKGRLQAFHVNESDQKVILGEILPGEFVGEMAYFNDEPRAASVIALEDSELFEIPVKTFDRVIYQKPAWAMKMIETLSKRLKKYIEKK
jgi:CRP/FNR family cyclic AMP-dependent transcriptional regulator